MQRILRGVGIRVTDGGNSGHKFMPNVGKVIAVCTSLNFNISEVQRLKATGATSRHVNQAAMSSCRFLTPIEAKVGDTVVYRYVHNYGDDDMVDTDQVLIDHDSLICRLDEDGTVYPLAGNVLVEDTRERVNPGISRILAVGAPIQQYYDFPDYKDDIPIKQGDIVGINHKQSIPIQDKDMGMAIASLYGATDISFIKRRHILFTIYAQS